MTMTVTEVGTTVRAIRTRFWNSAKNAPALLAIADEAQALLMDLDGWEDQSPGSDDAYRAAVCLGVMTSKAAEAAQALDEGHDQEFIDRAYEAYEAGWLLGAITQSPSFEEASNL